MDRSTLLFVLNQKNITVMEYIMQDPFFIGNFTPESAGDYASGTNHTLPTNGYAKNYSGVNLDSFTNDFSEDI
jgi:histidinol dehydrogenase